MAGSNSIFNTAAGLIARELMIVYLNTGTAASPQWSALGTRVEDSSLGYDWGDETKQDILGNTHSTMKKPVVTESFDPCNLDSADSAIVKVWDLGVKQQDAQALASMDLLLVHFYAGEESKPFAERYPSSMVKPTGLGGAGGGSMEMPIDVTFGGKRDTGTATQAADGTVTFASDSAGAQPASNKSN